MRSILLDIIPRRFRRRSYLVSGTIFLRALLNFAGLALLIPVLLLILDSESMHTNPWLERLYQAGGFESDRAFALTVCGCIVALIAFKNLLNLFLLRYERRYIYDLYRCMSRRLYIEYHDRGLGFIKNTNSALLSRNVNFVCLAFVTGILVPLASITSESMLLALLFTALLFYNPTVAGLVLLVFIPTVWFYYSAVRKRLHRYGVQENEAQREKARTVVETFRGYADLEINDAFPSMLRRFDRAMDKIVTIQSRNMTVNALPSIFMEVGLAIGMALFVAVSLGTPGDEARVLFGVFAVAGLRLMPSVRNMMSGWSALKYNRYTIDILRDIDLNDEKPEPSAAQPPLPFEREIAVRDLSFRFDDERGDKEVLHGLTLTIRKGEHVGIRGASGAGKTTLFNLLLGFYTPTGGEITIDGEPLTAANRRRWQNAVGYVRSTCSCWTAPCWKTSPWAKRRRKSTVGEPRSPCVPPGWKTSCNRSPQGSTPRSGRPATNCRADNASASALPELSTNRPTFYSSTRRPRRSTAGRRRESTVRSPNCHNTTEI